MTQRLEIKACSKIKSIGIGMKKQLVNMGNDYKNPSRGCRANPENGVIEVES